MTRQHSVSPAARVANRGVLIPSQERTDEEAGDQHVDGDDGRGALAPPERPDLRTAGVGLAAALVAGGLYAFGTQHTPDYRTSLFGQTGPDTFKLKSWLATGVLAFAAVQLGLALWMYGRLRWIGVPPPRASVPSTGRSAPLPSC